MLLRFSMGFKSGEQAGHCIILLFLAKTPFWQLRRCSIMHEKHVFYGMLIFTFLPCDEVLLQKVDVDFGSHFDSIRDFEWPNHLITNDCSPKHHTATPLLTPDSVKTWALLAVLHPSRPSRVARLSSLNRTCSKQCLCMKWKIM